MGRYVLIPVHRNRFCNSGYYFDADPQVIVATHQDVPNMIKSGLLIKASKKTSKQTYAPFSLINFSEAEKLANTFANLISSNIDDLTNILLKYESYEVVQDEISRTLDLLRNLRENNEYFKLRVNSIATFLPRNQPLYAFTCFVVVPSLMASEVHFRIPRSMHHFFIEMMRALNVVELFPNIKVSEKTRIEFLRDRSALTVNPKTGANRPITDAVIFTGTPIHASQLRPVFDRRTLFISNGSGHNPVIISEDADLASAVEAVTTLQFYNQGQDCAAPNSILVNKAVAAKFLNLLRVKIKTIKIGEYKDKSCQIGPISDPKDLIRITDFLVENRKWLDYSTPGIIKSGDAVVEPTIICKPLSEGGNFNEIFAPIIFVQEYKKDSDLKYYFEDKFYAPNAMYVTLYGSSDYTKRLIDRPIEGKVLHDKRSFLHNTHLHYTGVERGTEPYGGLGYGASSISIEGKITPMATLPQRDIYEYIAKPLLSNNAFNAKELSAMNTIEIKDVEKILRLHQSKPAGDDHSQKGDTTAYIDLGSIDPGSQYLKVGEKNIYHLLSKKNKEFTATLKKTDLDQIKKLSRLIKNKRNNTYEEFHSALYNIPKRVGSSKSQNIVAQRHFFQNIYQLLFNQDFGPKLAPFLWYVENKEIQGLLDI